MTIARKVKLLVLLAVVFLVAVGGAGYVATLRVAGLVDEYDQSAVPALQALSRIATAVGRATGAASALENGTLAVDVHARAAEVTASQRKAATEAVQALERVRDMPGVFAAATRARPLLAAWGDDLDALVGLAHDRFAASGRFAEAAAIQVKVTAQFEKLRQDSQQLLEVLDEAVAAAHADANALDARAGREVSVARWILGAAPSPAAMVRSGAGLPPATARPGRARS
jgi:hypothetical protein